VYPSGSPGWQAKRAVFAYSSGLPGMPGPFYWRIEMAKAAPGPRTVKKAVEVRVPARAAAPKLALHRGTPVSGSPIPFMSTGLAEADIAAAGAVLKSGMLRAAKKCEELEKRFAEMSGAQFGMTCANGTCALQLAYEPL